MPKIPLLAAGATALALGLAACGGSSSSSSQSSSAAGGSTGAQSTASSAPASSSSSAAAPATGGILGVAADPSGQLSFTQKTLTAKAGTVKIDFTNKSPVGHNLTIQQGANGPVVGATPTFSGGSKTLTVKLKPGSYTFFCSVPGHRGAGMQGTITVK
jgi:plastocyanin